MANALQLIGGSVPRGLESLMKVRKATRITDIVRKENNMAFFVPHDIISKVENCKLDFEKGKNYICIKSFYIAGGGFDFTKGKVYKCNESYTIPCNNGRNISQWRLIGVENMFKLVNHKEE